ncbi:hypothetical protein [Allochromatium tepidum]|uniref:Uncharacterized protein n=1 Tax=Allochromatium tepidum TaxID=553982 RepID=A0ABM7QPU6_9GAMM|nr:hypothetical protein [Allochromatium tepidum]BCU07937.1 hypothetical protein Atep_26140 [Allochromatium tepidum]
MFLKNIGKDTFRVVERQVGEASQKMSGLDLGSETGSLDDWGANLTMRAWIGKAPDSPDGRRPDAEASARTIICAIFVHFTVNG